MRCVLDSGLDKKKEGELSSSIPPVHHGVCVLFHLLLWQNLSAEVSRFLLSEGEN